jgi:hypothetical protein
MDHVHIEEQIRPFKAKDLWHLLMTLREEKIARVLKIVECVYFCYRFLTINIMVVLMKNQKLNHGIYFLQRCLSVLFVIFLDATGCATDCRAYVAEMSQPQHAFHIGPEDYSFSKLTLRLDMVDQCFHYILCFINGIDSQRASVKANLPGV